MPFQPLTVLLLLCAALLLLFGCSLLLRTLPTTISAAQAQPATPSMVWVPILDSVPTPHPPKPPARRTPIDTVDDAPPEPIPTPFADVGSVLQVESPTCYELPAQHFVCLGRVFNPQSSPAAAANIQLTTDVSAHILTKSITLEQHSLQPGAFAPYRLFLQDYAPDSLQMHIANAVLRQPNTNPIQVQAENGELIQSVTGSVRYVVTADVLNTSTAPADNVRAIVTLLDADNLVVGYRILEWRDGLASGEQRKLHMALVPQVVDQNLHHSLTIESTQDH